MMKNDNKIKVICFGEILWDVLGSKYLPGGAPLNVAYHLKRLSVDSEVISKIGRDSLGKKLISVINNWGINTSNIQFDDKYPTSEVLPIIGADHEITYDIRFPVAWDNIDYDDSLQVLVTEAKALVFGSLVARNEPSRKTLHKLLKMSTYNVFDVNLREKNYSQETILELLRHTQLLKMNENELHIISGYLNYDSTDNVEAVRFIQNSFNINEVLVTKGDKGADYYVSGDVFHTPAYNIKLKDTIGSGDAFLASFLAGKFHDPDIKQNLKQASALGALIASSEGACPHYNLEDLKGFMNFHADTLSKQEPKEKI